ncbi:signal peptide peptidase SppA [Actinocorallia sp. A-T 12471]|uniref:signal peptide peptidase SppA n=1 Tax=Actinocorallia sp. A-T 12471 TaxID=3089813 RepID=UPI0029D1F2B1|nr:signal peptide peptidase SppA [Actinocorallia sp. A-T 12471]MDX6738973.1 signal peptide peptidase SppA [Actinocorallia sp. A-T 12471]
MAFKGLDSLTALGPVRELRDRRTGPLILELDLSEGLVEGSPPDPVTALMSMRRTHLRDVLDGLRKARTDPRVKALVARINGPVGIALAQELRDAVAELRAAGKLTVAWTETFGESGEGTPAYYLASAFERVCLQPSGDVGITGFALSEPFVKDALDKAGIAFRFGRRAEYKTAPNMFLETRYTSEHAEASERLVASVGEQFVDGVAASRGIAAEDVRELVDRAPLLASEALEAGLVDELCYRDEVYARVREAAGPDARLQYVSRYNRASLTDRVPRKPADGIALIQAQGMIRLGRSGRGPVPGQGGAVGSDTLAAALRAAVRDPKTKAIVLRVNSPGGSYVASDVIWREVILARRAGKPVLVSMGNVAASGGYFIAMAADKIVAQPGTFTGSIGVYTGKPVVTGLLDRLGVGFGSASFGDHAGMHSTVRDFTEGEWARINTSLDRIYADFTSKAAQGRGLELDKIEDLARGRVWTGADAAERGLVDELGGLDRTLDLARRAAKLPADAPVRSFPHVSPLDRFRPPESSDDRTAANTRFEAWGSLAGAAARLGFPTAGPLVMPGYGDLRW